MKNNLSLNRICSLGKSDFILHWKELCLSSGIVAVILLVYTIIITASFLDTHSAANIYNVRINYDDLFKNVLFIWGIVQASYSFRELHDKSKNEQYLLLPASPLEKLIVRFVFTSVVLPFLIIVLITLISIAGEIILIATKSVSTLQPFNPFSWSTLKFIGILIIIQSIFSYGSAYFKKNHLLKTIFSAILLGVITTLILSGIIARVFHLNYLRIILFSSNNFGDLSSTFPYSANTLSWRRPLGIIWTIFTYGVILPTSWFLTWLKIKKTQSSDGI